MDEEQRRLENYKLIFAHYKWMEKKYHTWMNYYSLFNGALLVAYCTILVSTGKIVEMEGNVSSVEITNVGAKFFYLDCTYWDILSLIAILGVIASYCWYLSMIGHRSWLNSWERILDDEGMEFDQLVYVPYPGGRLFTHFHSTYKVTIFFIYTVLFAWIFVAMYSFGYHKIAWNLFIFCFSASLFLVCLECFLHFVFGSDLEKNRQLDTLNLKFVDRICLVLSLNKRTARRSKKYCRCIWMKLIILVLAALLMYESIPQKSYISHRVKLKYKTMEINSCDTIKKIRRLSMR